MRILVCGDLHTKFHIFEQVKELTKNYDKVIFLGDYCDEWDTVSEASCNLVQALIEYKQANPDKVTLCLGNHDASETFAGTFRCSAFSPMTYNLISPLIKSNLELFEVACMADGWLCSHAGFTTSWVEYYLPDCQTPEEIIEKVNHTLYHYKDPDNDELFYALSNAGYMRGGSGIPSPLWADANELMEDFLPDVKQVVGHTPFPTTTVIDQLGRNLIFCDTHSLYSDKRPIGDNSLLELIDGEPHKIFLQNS